MASEVLKSRLRENVETLRGRQLKITVYGETHIFNTVRAFGLKILELTNKGMTLITENGDLGSLIVKGSRESMYNAIAHFGTAA